jgi:hypothetical protein
MKTKEQVETMLLKCRLAAALADEDGYERPVGWCDAIRWVLDHGSKDHWFESDVASRTKDHMCEE